MAYVNSEDLDQTYIIRFSEELSSHEHSMKSRKYKQPKSKYCDQSARLRRLIPVLAFRISHKVCFLTNTIICIFSILLPVHNHS